MDGGNRLLSVDTPASFAPYSMKENYDGVAYVSSELHVVDQLNRRAKFKFNLSFLVYSDLYRDTYQTNETYLSNRFLNDPLRRVNIIKAGRHINTEVPRF